MRGLRLRRPHKYGATRVNIDGYTFASKLEAGRYRELKLLEKAGAITNLTVHPKFKIEINGEHICDAIMDFSYLKSGDGQAPLGVNDLGGIHFKKDVVVEDTKGHDLPISKLKRKLIRAVHGIEVEVIRA